MTARKITIATATKIARKVLAFIGSVDPRSVNIEEQVNGWLADVGLGWKLKPGTCIDGVDCQFIGDMAKTIRANAVEK